MIGEDHVASYPMNCVCISYQEHLTAVSGNQLIKKFKCVLIEMRRMVLSVVSLVVTFSLELNLRITAPAQVLCDFTYGLISCYSSTLLTAVSSDAMAPLHLNLKNI